MRQDYESYFHNLKESMDKFGYLSLIEGDIYAEFHLHNGWILEFVGEKYYAPMFDVAIIALPPFDKKRKNYTSYYFRDVKGVRMEVISYTISELKLAFERLKGRCYTYLPNNWIKSEIAFLEREKEIIFSYPEFYEKEYKAIWDLTLEERNAIGVSHKAGIVTPPATTPTPKKPQEPLEGAE